MEFSRDKAELDRLRILEEKKGEFFNIKRDRLFQNYDSGFFLVF